MTIWDAMWGSLKWCLPARAHPRQPIDHRGLELHPNHVAEDLEITVAPAHHGAWQDALHLLCHHTHVGLVAAVIGEAVEAEAIGEAPKQHDVMLERNVGSPATAAPPTTAEASAAPEPPPPPIRRPPP